MGRCDIRVKQERSVVVGGQECRRADVRGPPSESLQARYSTPPSAPCRPDPLSPAPASSKTSGELRKKSAYRRGSREEVSGAKGIGGLSACGSIGVAPRHLPRIARSVRMCGGGDGDGGSSYSGRRGGRLSRSRRRRPGESGIGKVQLRMRRARRIVHGTSLPRPALPSATNGVEAAQCV